MSQYSSTTDGESFYFEASSDDGTGTLVGEGILNFSETSPLVVSLPPLPPRKPQKSNSFNLLHPTAQHLRLPVQPQQGGDGFLYDDCSSYQRGSVVSDLDIDDHTLNSFIGRDLEHEGLHHQQQQQQHQLEGMRLLARFFDDDDDVVPKRRKKKRPNFCKSLSSSSRNSRSSGCNGPRMTLVWALVVTVTLCGLAGAILRFQESLRLSNRGRHSSSNDHNDNNNFDDFRNSDSSGSDFGSGRGGSSDAWSKYTIEHVSRLRRPIPIPQVKDQLLWNNSTNITEIIYEADTAEPLS